MKAMKETVGILDFVKRQTPESRYNHFDGSWEELLELVRQNWNRRSVSPHNREVVLVPVADDQVGRFYASIVAITPETPLKAEFSARMSGEDPFIQVTAPGAKKSPARRVEIVCYSHDVLAQDGDAPPTREADWYIVSINAYASDEPEPMRPITMARNFLGLTGGTKPEVPYTAEEFARAIVYWSRHVRAGD